MRFFRRTLHYHSTIITFQLRSSSLTPGTQHSLAYRTQQKRAGNLPTEISQENFLKMEKNLVA